MDKLPIPTWVYIMLWSGAILCFAVPLSHVVLAQNTTTVPTSQLLGQTMDVWLATIGSGISLALLGLKWLDTWLRSRKQSAVNDKAISVVEKLFNSLKESDVWIKDNVVAHKEDLNELFSILSSHKAIDQAMQDPRVQDLLNKANVTAAEAKNEIDRYYGYASKVSGIDSKITPVAKLAELEQFLTPAGPSTVHVPPSGTVIKPSTDTSDAV
jgi:hypothetical protein